MQARIARANASPGRAVVAELAEARRGGRQQHHAVRAGPVEALPRPPRPGPGTRSPRPCQAARASIAARMRGPLSGSGRAPAWDVAGRAARRPAARSRCRGRGRPRSAPPAGRGTLRARPASAARWWTGCRRRTSTPRDRRRSTCSRLARRRNPRGGGPQRRLVGGPGDAERPAGRPARSARCGGCAAQQAQRGHPGRVRVVGGAHPLDPRPEQRGPLAQQVTVAVGDGQVRARLRARRQLVAVVVLDAAVPGRGDRGAAR